MASQNAQDNPFETDGLAARLASILPLHKAGLAIKHNPHQSLSQSAGEHLGHLDALTSAWCNCEDDWRNEEHKARAIASDDYWLMTWYPNTPGGSNSIAAPTLAELLEFAAEMKERAP